MAEPDASAAIERDLRLALAAGLEHNFACWLRFVGWQPGSWLELQALGVPGRYGDRVCFAHADSVESATGLLERAERLRASGLYTIANTINPAVATRATPRQWHDAKKGSSTSERDITHRRVVFIDVDCRRPSGTSATDGELAQTLPVAAAVRAWFEARVGPGPLASAASGNGRQVFLALEETPETPGLAATVRELIEAVSKRFSTPEAPVDGAVFDAKRLVPAFGTTKRKGAAGIPERPHRVTAFACANEVSRIKLETLEGLLGELRSEIGAPAARSVGRAGQRATDDADDDDGWDLLLPSRGRADRFARANAVAIEGVAEALGLFADGVVTCPGCKNTSGVGFFNNGLKCHHQSCSSKGVPGRAGFRTAVDLVVEAQSLAAPEAAAWILERFAGDVSEPSNAPVAPAGPEPLPPAGDRLELTDAGNAQRFVQHHGADLRHCDLWGKWLVWDDSRWAIDTRREVDLRAVQTSAAMRAEGLRLSESTNERKAKSGATLLAHAKRSDMAAGLANMVRVARCLPGIPIVPAQLDADPLLFNCRNGTLDLRTGELRPPRREDNLTKLAPVAFDAAARAPLWDKFLREIMANDEDLVGFLQRAVGYAMTGSVQEHALFFFHGEGANGKSTFLNVLLRVFGDYGRPAAPDILVARKNESHPTEVASLFGARLVVAQELDAGRALAEGMVKKLTGGAPIMARRMAEDFWEFAPTHKFFLAANHKPRVTGTDEAIWRRIYLVPFNVTFPKEKRDGALTQKLLGDRAGILRWAVEGCRQWSEGGLRPPAQVLNATREYRDEEDRIAAFLDERCELGPEFTTSSTDLYRAYTQWCDLNTMRPIGWRTFADALRSHRCAPDKGSKGTRRWLGVRVRNEYGPPSPGPGSRGGGHQGDLDWTDA